MRWFCEGRIDSIAQVLVQTGTENPENYESVTSTTDSGVSLSSDDVLGYSSQKLEWEQEALENQSGSLTDTLSSTSSMLTTTWASTLPQVPEVSEKTPELVSDYCSNKLLGPIAFWGVNDAKEVAKLEAFLKSQGLAVLEDGAYGTGEYEAVKAFQLAHRSEILDPWGITTPTGYVFRTTIAKMNEVACK